MGLNWEQQNLDKPANWKKPRNHFMETLLYVNIPNITSKLFQQSAENIRSNYIPNVTFTIISKPRNCRCKFLVRFSRRGENEEMEVKFILMTFEKVKNLIGMKMNFAFFFCFKCGKNILFYLSLEWMSPGVNLHNDLFSMEF